jgi:hypothetical protein
MLTYNRRCEDVLNACWAVEGDYIQKLADHPDDVPLWYPKCLHPLDVMVYTLTMSYRDLP